MGQTLRLSSPWVIYFRQIEALFGKDPAIKIEFDEIIPEIRLFVTGELKAEAISKLLPSQKNFGGVTLKITVILANDQSDDPYILFSRAFEGNPALAYVRGGTTPMTDESCFVVFANEVVQYFNDNAFDVHGVKSTLYQDIATEIFPKVHNTYYCTDTK